VYSLWLGEDEQPLHGGEGRGVDASLHVSSDVMLCCAARQAKVSHKEQTDWRLLMRQMKNFSAMFDVQQVNENPAVCE
jgi:hypothetical protein